MAGGPSPNSTSPSNLNNSSFLATTFGPSSSPPNQHFSGTHNPMATDVFSTSRNYGPPAPIGERRGMENGTNLLASSEAESSASPESKNPPAILLRKLPKESNRDDVRKILLWAQDLIDCEVISTSKYPEDKGFAQAVARFRTLEGAKEARDRLNGKRFATSDANIIVEFLPEGYPGAIGSRRNTVDSTAMRQGSISAAAPTSTGTTNGRQSRYNGTFQSMEKAPPQNGTPGLGNGEFPAHNPFSPTSPMASTYGHRNLGKTVINDEPDDDDGLLKESIGYATGAQVSAAPVPRRTANPSMPLSRFQQSLSINTSSVNGIGHQMYNYPGARSAVPHVQSPNTSAALPMAAMSAHPTGMNGMGGMNPMNGYQYAHTYPRHQYPPVNPADQNPPCNTLYVGNLPVDTNEDELKALFSKQRGYKRLCYRTKSNGPMCFVEFEDISFATKALNELYGTPLHNSVKGGIRLSFSKNPLGVRANQTPGTPAMSQSSTMAGFPGSGAAPSGFTTATGPPPGLSAPPGLPTANATGAGFTMYSNGGFGPAGNDISPHRHHPQSAGPTSNGVGNGYGLNGGSVPSSNGAVNGYGAINGGSVPPSNGAAIGYSGLNGGSVPPSNGAANGYGSLNGGSGPTNNGTSNAYGGLNGGSGPPNNGGANGYGGLNGGSGSGPANNGTSNAYGGLNGGYNPYNMSR